MESKQKNTQVNGYNPMQDPASQNEKDDPLGPEQIGSQGLPKRGNRLQNQQGVAKPEQPRSDQS